MKVSMVILIALLLCGCTEPAIQEGEGTYTDSDKEVTTAKIKMQDGQLKEVELDQTSGDTTKKNLQENYHMKAASAILNIFSNKSALIRSRSMMKEKR